MTKHKLAYLVLHVDASHNKPHFSGGLHLAAASSKGESKKYDSTTVTATSIDSTPSLHMRLLEQPSACCWESACSDGAVSGTLRHVPSLVGQEQLPSLSLSPAWCAPICCSLPPQLAVTGQSRLWPQRHCHGRKRQIRMAVLRMNHVLECSCCWPWAPRVDDRLGHDLP